MRRVWIATTALLGAVMTAAPAVAQMPAINSRLQRVAPEGGALTDLAPGDDMAVACDAIKLAVDPSDVRVVLTIAIAPGETGTGYQKILAVNQKVENGAVHLKVPDAPNLENHTVDLKIYVVGGQRNEDCEGGRYRIVGAPAGRAPG